MLRPLAPDALAGQEEEDGLTEYERRRLENIARNRAALMALGIPEAAAELAKRRATGAQASPRLAKVPKTASVCGRCSPSSRCRV